MTKWSEPDKYGWTWRSVGDYELVAWTDGRWAVLDAATRNKGTAPDLASAQAAADAACEVLLREALADFGLVFVQVMRANIPLFRAVGFDGTLYEIRQLADDEWRWETTVCDGVGHVSSLDLAIAAARAHDEQRRGAK